MNAPGRDRYDLVVIGLGGLGSAASYWASRRGLATLGIERFELGHVRGASEDHSRIIRRTYPTTDYLRFARAAFEAWGDVEWASGERLVLRTGGLDLFPPGGVDDLGGYSEAMQAEDVPFEVFDGDELMRRWPVWRVEPATQVLFQPDAGVVAASLANATHRRLALKHGAELVEHTTVQQVTPERDGYLVRTDAGEVRSDALVVTADAWTNDILASFDVRLSLRLLQEQVTYLDAATPDAFEPGAFPVWIWHDLPHTYGLPAFGLPGPKVALHGAGPSMGPDERTFEPDPHYQATVLGFVQRHLPEALGPLLEVKTCQYTLTPDAHFVLDRIPGQERAVLGLGTGHAFKFASVFGRSLVELALDGSTPFAFPRFAADRPELAVRS